MFYVYVLKCKDKSFYTGITRNLRKRTLEHQLGRVPFTKNRNPIQLACWENFRTRKEAAKREKEIKGWRREKKEILIKNFKNSLH